MDTYEAALELLPSPLRLRLSPYSGRAVEELRLRVGRRPALVEGAVEHEVPAAPVEQREIMQVLEKATGASLHSAAEAMAKGYYCSRGFRIGICGEAAVSDGQVSAFRNFSSIAIRIPRQCRGVCDSVAARVFKDGADSVLVISPPGYGKTTALRELVRFLSNGGTRVSLIDERNEISASAGGQVAFDLGRCCDVLVNVPKEQGAVMLLRGMNPQVIAMDEITKTEDAKVIETISGCGVAILAGAHAANREDMLKRHVYRELLEAGIFNWLIIIELSGGQRCYRVESLKR